LDPAATASLLVFTPAIDSVSLIQNDPHVGGHRNDYACLAGETVFTEFPKDMWATLISASAVAVLTAQKDFEHAAAEHGVLERRLASVRFLAEPRSNDPDVIINHSSPLRRGRFR
jgi:hypothetical protein